MPTQAERSAATREKVIAATIDCLVERGYAGATVAAVAERAGISRGALSHQYPDKQGLVIDTIEEIARRRSLELHEQIEGLRPGRRRVARGLDELWDAFTGPVFVAALEVYVAARTDVVLAPRIGRLETELDQRLREFIGVLVADRAPADLDAVADVLVNTLRGIALLWATGAPRAPLERTWQRVRAEALERFARPSAAPR
jgi:AcrR family transcriptional regulator